MSMPISKVVVAAYKKDFWLVEICISSIRYWYPDIPVAIVYDYSKGTVDFSHVKREYNAEIIDLPIKNFGWGLSKIEYLFLPTNEKVLILDADTILLGPVIDYLNSFDADFIISADHHAEPYAKWMNECYFDYAALQKFDESFQFPGYSFNTGQFVATTGKLKREDFNRVINWKEFPEILQPSIFSCVDQGILNYVLPLEESKAKITLVKADILMGIRYAAAEKLKVEDLRQKINSSHYILHWAGSNTNSLRFMQRNDLLKFFRNRNKGFLQILNLEKDELVRYCKYQNLRVLNKLKRMINA